MATKTRQLIRSRLIPDANRHLYYNTTDADVQFGAETVVIARAALPLTGKEC
jgi:hypothetical protein